MTLATSPSPIRIETGQGDIRTIQPGRTWEQFKHLQKGFENTRGLRLFYHNGTIEILMPGEAHELFKSVIGFLIEAFLFQRGHEFKPTGSMTQEKEGIAAAEADESYQIGGNRPQPAVGLHSDRRNLPNSGRATAACGPSYQSLVLAGSNSPKAAFLGWVPLALHPAYKLKLDKALGG